MTTLSRDLDLAVFLAMTSSCRVLMDYHRIRDTYRLKDGGEIVTAADDLVDTFISSYLAKRRPKDYYFSEERSDDLTRLTYSKVWIVDPIDGSKPFLGGSRDFLVNIGHVVDTRLRLGACGLPAYEQLYFAELGGPAYRSSFGSFDLHTVTVSGCISLDDMCLVMSKRHQDKMHRDIISCLAPRTIKHRHASLKTLMVASGEADVYIGLWPRMSEWDVCGPSAIAISAGGRVTDIDGNDLKYNQPNPRLANGIVVSNGVLHDAVLERLRPLRFVLGDYFRAHQQGV